MFDVFLDSVARIGEPQIILALLGGSLIGMVFGLIPGLGGIQALTICLPITFGWDPEVAMFLFAGIMGSVTKGGSIPAILINTPGMAPNACTCIDGFPMAQRGEAGRAIGLAASSSVLGSLFGVIVLLLLIPLVRLLIFAFGPPEFFWLIMFGIVAIAFVASSNFLKGLVTGGLGILLSFIGYSEVFGVRRFTLGSDYLWDGIYFVPFFIGIFAIGELLSYTTRGGVISSKGIHVRSLSSVFDGFREIFKYPATFFRGSFIGVMVGLIPGIGGSVANFLSYTTAVQISKRPQTFGKGNPEGIVASESSNDAKDGGSLLPTLGFGIPGSPEMAVLLGAFMLHGIQPGPFLLKEHPEIVVSLISGLVVANLISSVLMIAAADQLAKVTLIPVKYIAPVVMVIGLTGAFASRGNMWDVLLAIIAGLFGYTLKRYGFPVIPLVMGFILGVLAETAFYQTFKMGLRSYLVFFSSPISLLLFALVLLLLLYPFWQQL
ncbi:tripartite tricarboxylate transporter permease, partial [Thermodesulfobacteriota bacterium]